MTEQQQLEPVSLPYRFGAERATYLMPSVLFGVLMALGLWASLLSPSAWPIVGIIGALLVVSLIAVNALRVSVTAEGIESKTFLGTKRMAFAAMRRVSLTIGGANGPAPCLAIDGPLGTRPFVLNIKPYGKNDLAALMQAIAAAVPGIPMDPLSHDLMARNVKTIESATTKAVISRQMSRLITNLIGLAILAAIVAIIRALSHR
jgi:hypothetical protein